MFKKKKNYVLKRKILKIESKKKEKVQKKK